MSFQLYHLAKAEIVLAIIVQNRYVRDEDDMFTYRAAPPSEVLRISHGGFELRLVRQRSQVECRAIVALRPRLAFARAVDTFPSQ